MQQTILDGFAVVVEDHGDAKHIVLVEQPQGPYSTVYVCPLPIEVAKKVAADLLGSKVEVAPASALQVIGRR